MSCNLCLSLVTDSLCSAVRVKMKKGEGTLFGCFLLLFSFLPCLFAQLSLPASLQLLNSEFRLAMDTAGTINIVPFGNASGSIFCNKFSFSNKTTKPKLCLTYSLQ